jgi:poly-beta-1,6-N-acetyl-D-glucosamine synthase
MTDATDAEVGGSGLAMKGQNLKYVLITPARNEEDFIEQTIRSVVSQTARPHKWVIISDGSTDRTDDIVKKYVADHKWMELVRKPERRDRHFAAKVQCFNTGYERVLGEDFCIIGNLDADITFGKDHFEFLLSKFAEDSTLGVAGTPFVEGTTSYDFRFTTVEHVSGACQLFRRECFEQIGGYVQVKGGGIDWIAVTTARMKGWKTRTFVDRVCYHHRPMGTASAGRLRANFKLGKQDYYLGGHPAWQLSRGCYQMARKPYILGGLFLLAGYLWAWISRVHRPVSPELIRFHRHEQMQRLRQAMSRVIRIRATKGSHS